LALITNGMEAPISKIYDININIPSNKDFHRNFGMMFAAFYY